MHNMNKSPSFTFITLFCISMHAVSQKSSTKFSAEVITNNAAHIGRITKDSIIVITGSTYSFTVDTPEDSGLVSTNTTVKQLVSEVKASDGSSQKYVVTHKDGSIEDNGYLLNGDHLIVTSQDGKTIKTYTIAVQPMAL